MGSPRKLACAALCLWLAAGCGAQALDAEPAAPELPSDPTPLARCRISKSSENPLVTEWPASEKAHLQSLMAVQPVAVRYSGCELEIIDACRVSGSYGFQRTTLATDTVEITNADELYAKLPLGAVSLEGELERSGSLAVQTTVAGQLRLDGARETLVEPGSPCADATHWVNAVSVGAFRMLSGKRTQGSGRIDTPLGDGGGETKSTSRVLREAGIASACAEAPDSGPHPQCGAPIQLFLAPVLKQAVLDQRKSAQASGAIEISMPPPEAEDERWTLRTSGGDPLCALPCSHWVPPASGYYLQREASGGHAVTTVKLPASFPYQPGAHVSAAYRPERGSPTWSTIAFWGMGVPCFVGGTAVTVLGIIDVADGPCAEDDFGCHDLSGFFFGAAAMYFAFAGASTYWYLWSHEESFETRPATGTAFEAGTRGNRRMGLRSPVPAIVIGPGIVRGTF